MTDIEKRAADVVAEMFALGASFTIADDGERWVWEPHPPVMRNAIRRYWDGVEDRNEPGFRNAMLAAIRSLEGRASTCET